MSTCDAIHVIWTTYASWLPGDARGHWSPLYDLYGNLIEQGHKLNLPDPVTHQLAASKAKEPPRILTDADQLIVAETIERMLAEDFGGKLSVYATAIERTHVHLLLGASPFPIAQAVGKLKGRTSSELIARGSESDRARTWTSGYWKVSIYESDVLHAVRSYIEQHNVWRGMARTPFRWIVG